VGAPPTPTGHVRRRSVTSVASTKTAGAAWTASARTRRQCSMSS